MILAGAKPDYPEVDYGWIEPDAPLGPDEANLFRVRAFREKPPLEDAQALLEQGTVRNTLVVAGHVRAVSADG